MNAPVKNEPAYAAGLAQREKHNSSYNKNLAPLYRRVNMLCNKWNMSRKDFEQAASMWAFMHRDCAPQAVRIMYSGRPSFYSEDVKRLSLAFLIAYTEADDRLKALGTDGLMPSEPVNARECWKIALHLVGGAL